MAYRWPTDPPGKKPSHSISWASHQSHMGTQGTYGSQQGSLGSQGNKAANVATQQTNNSIIVGPPPFDAELEARRSAANQRRTTLLADSNVDIKQASQEYGFGFNMATGAIGGFDPTNPFSQAALLMKARKERDKGENTSYASQGQFGSSAYAAAKKETGYQYDKGYDTLRRGFQDYVKNYLRRQRDIRTVGIEELANL